MKVVTLLSGGIDSSTLLYYLRNMKGVTGLIPVFIDYGQRHSIEKDSAYAISRTCLGINPEYANLSISLKGSSQTDKTVEVPEGHYTHESMKATIVPNRNMMLLSIAAAIGISQDCTHIAYAAHAGDHAIYPDCRHPFIQKLTKALELAHTTPIHLFAPFVFKTKAEIVKIGAGLGVPFELTYSCYKGATLHCGKCGTCVERKEAFKLAGVEDPTKYEE